MSEILWRWQWAVESANLKEAPRRSPGGGYRRGTIGIRMVFKSRALHRITWEVRVESEERGPKGV